MRLADLPTEPRHRAVVVASERLTPEDSPEEVRELLLALDDPVFRYRPGQSIGVLVPGPHVFGQPAHLRLYSVADTARAGDDQRPRVRICVRRCSHLDPVSGERFPGVASGYLCDRRAGDEVVLTGPYGAPFELPADRDADLLMIGLGTGIAPFRALVRHIYEDLGGWGGRVRLFHGARTGLESVYMNERRDDFARYRDERTFRAFAALRPRPHREEPPDLEAALAAHREEVWEMLGDPRTHVYVAGLESVLVQLDRSLAAMAGSMQEWQRRKAELVAGRRWTELVY